MRISPITPINSNSGIAKIERLEGREDVTKTGDAISQFKDSIKSALGEVNRLQQQADVTAVKLASGETEDVHTAMIQMQKAKLALDFTIQVRNKVIEAYQEIMRMQV